MTLASPHRSRGSLAVLAFGLVACGSFAREDAAGIGDDGSDEVGPGPGPTTPDETAVPEPAEPTDPTGSGCDTDEDVQLFLSPDDSNSMSSPVQTRAATLGDWGSLSDIAVRPWEFLNYYRVAYPAAEPGTLGLHAAMALPIDERPGEVLLQIGVASPQIPADARPPMSLTFVLDRSGSMEGHPMEMLKRTCREVASNLTEGDVVSMVTWDTENQIVLQHHAIGGPDDPTLLAAIDALEADGATDLESGLRTGYELAAALHRVGVVSRVLLVSDGGANAGVTDVETIAMHAGDEGQDGIYLVGVGVGTPETYNDALMDLVTDAGKGASVFVPEASEAQWIFRDRFMSTMAIAARDVRVQLDLPPGYEIVRFSGEGYSDDPSEIEPQHLAPDDAMVFHQRLRTCSGVIDPADAVSITIRWQDPVSFEPDEQVLDTTIGELLAADSTLLLEGAAIFEYATAVAEVQAFSPSADEAIELADRALARALAASPTDPDLAEIGRVLARL